MTRTAVAAPADPFDDLFAFIDTMPVSHLAALTSRLFLAGWGVTLHVDQLDPCGECRKGFCDQCADCKWTEQFA